MTGGLFTPSGSLPPLWPHQERAFAELRARMLAGAAHVMLVIPTGGGKTRLAIEIIKNALVKCKRVVVLVPRISLVPQWLLALADAGITCVGVLQADHPGYDPDQPLQLCSVQTFGRRMRPPADLVIVDEAHLLYKAVLAWLTDPEQKHVRFVGLSATPWTSGLGRVYDALIVGATLAELIEAERLSPFRVFAPSEPDLAGIRTVAGDYHEGELAERCDTTKLVGDVIAEWTKRGEDRQTLSYGTNRAHARHIQERFQEVGVACEYVDCFTDRPERERIFETFRKGQVKVISSVAALEVGIDLPIASCIIDARPTKSRMAFVQRIGRGLRVAPGKTDCLILDHAGNHLRLGMVTDIYQDHLDDGTSTKNKKEREAKERSEPLPRLCDECRAVIPPKAKQCPSCSAPVLTRTDVKQEDGELVELGARRSRKSEPTITDKAIFHAELRGYAAARGYGEGWIAHKYREKFGVWPNDPRIKSSPAISPSLSTRNWITGRQIAWAKRRAG
jgi:DNA repair protein RadD